MSKEIVKPSQEEVAQFVKDIVETKDVLARDGSVKRTETVIHKTALDKLMKHFGVPMQVVKQHNDILSMVSDEVTNMVASRLADRVEEEKAAGTSVDDLKQLRERAKIATSNGSIRIEGLAYAEYQNPRSPESGKIATTCVIRTRISAPVDNRHISKSKFAERIAKAMGL